MADTERKVVRWERKVVSMEQIFQVDGELSFGPETAPIEQVVAANFDVMDLTTEIADGGVFVRGRVIPEVLVKTLMDEAAPNAAPFNAMVDSTGFVFERWLEIPTLPKNARVAMECEIYKGFAERELHHSVKIQVEVLAKVSAFEAMGKEIITDVAISQASELNMAKDVFRAEESIGQFSGETSVQATLDLPYLKSPIARVIWTQVAPSQVRWEVDNGHVKVEGGLIVNTTYISSDDQGQEGMVEMAEWGKGSSMAPLHWQVDIEIPKSAVPVNIWPTVRCNGISVNANNSESLRFQTVVKVEIAAAERWEGEAVIDLASPSEVLDLQRQSFKVDDIIADQSSVIHVEKVLEMPSGKPDIGRIVGYSIGGPRVKGDSIPGKVLIEGNIGLQVIYTAADEERFPGLYSASWEGSSAVEWGETLEVPAVDEGMKLDLSGRVQEAIVEIADGKRVRFVQEIGLRCQAVDTRDISVIADWAMIPQDAGTGRPSMIFYLTQPGDSYWSIARRYQTTMDALAKGNHLLLDDPLPMGKRLIIPKAVK